MRQILTKQNIKIALIGFVCFFLAYSFDQYYINRKQLFFLSKPVQYINQLLQTLSK